MKHRPISKICKKCQASCCKRGRFFGSPILTFAEAAEIIKRRPDSLEMIVETFGPDGGCYYTIKPACENNHCYFLDDGNRCSINDIKPLDCQCYPYKAVYRYSRVKYIADKNCPVAGRLHYQFIRRAKENAYRSISRFTKGSYQHWVENHVSWYQL